MEELLKRKQLLKRLIEKEEDEEQLKELSEQYDEVVQAIAVEKYKQEQEKATAEAKQKEEDEAAKKALEDAQKGLKIPDTKIEVGTPGLYKARFGTEFRLKKELEIVQGNESVGGKYLFDKYPAIKQRMADRPEKTEKVLKLFADIIDDSFNNPVRSKAALQEGTDSEGGYLVPTEERSELISYLREPSIALREGTHIKMTSSSMTLPRELTKVSVAFTAEESDATETEPTFDQVTLTAKRMDAFGITSKELIEDAFVEGGIAGLLLDQFVEAVGLKVDSAAFQGTGDPVSGLFEGVAGYSEVFDSGSTAFSELLESNVRNIVGSLPEHYINTNGKFYMHYTPKWQYVKGLKDDNGNYLFYDSRSGQRDQERLWGYPLVSGSQMPSSSAADTAFIVFGNMRGFWIGDRLTNISLFMDPYTGAKAYQMYFYMFTRWGFAVAQPNYFGTINTAAS